MTVPTDASLEEDGWAQVREVKDTLSQGHFAEIAAAIPILERVLLTAGDTTKLEAAVHSGFAAVYGSMGRFADALQHSKRQLAIAVELGDAESRAVALGNMGLAFTAMGQPARQVDCIHEALALCRAEKDHDGECVQHANLGGALKALGQRDLAFQAHREELALAELHKLTNRIVGAHGRVGSAYKDNGALDKAMEHFQKQMQLAKDAGDGLNERKAFVSIAGAPDAEHAYTKGPSRIIPSSFLDPLQSSNHLKN